MAVLVICQSCQRKLNVKDEIVGRRVKCPGCAAIFTAVAVPVDPPAPQVPPPISKQTRASMPGIKAKSQPDFDEEGEEESADESRVRQKISARDSQAGWKATKTGINLLLISAYLYLSGIILQVINFLLVQVIRWTAQPGAGPGPGLAYTIFVLLIIVGILSFGAFVVHTVGLGFCLKVPKKEGTSTKTLALLTFIFWCTGIGFYILGIPLTLICIGFIMIIIAPFLVIAAHVLYLFFLRSVGLLMKRKDLAGSATGFMFANLGYVVSVFAFVGIMFSMVGFAPRDGGRQAVIAFVQTMGIGMIIGVVFLAIFALVLLAWYMILLRNIRDGITPKLTKGDS